MCLSLQPQRAAGGGRRAPDDRPADASADPRDWPQALDPHAAGARAARQETVVALVAHVARPESVRGGQPPQARSVAVPGVGLGVGTAAGRQGRWAI